MPTPRDLSRQLQEERQQLDLFSQEARQQMGQLMQELDGDFTRFLDKLLTENLAQFESQVAEILGSQAFDARQGSGMFGAGLSGSLLASGLSAVLQRVFGKRRRRRSRSALQTGANAVGRVIAGGIAPSRDRMRLSRSQMSQEAMGTLARGQRNS